MKSGKNNPFALLRLDGLKVSCIGTADLQKEIDRRLRRVFAMCSSDSATVRGAANEAIREYTDGQRAMFAAKGLNPDRALREAIVAADDDGRVVYRIIPRDVTLEEIDTGADDGHRLSIAAARSYSDRAGLGRDMRRGRYHDADMLINQSACSIDPEEVAAWTSM